MSSDFEYCTLLADIMHESKGMHFHFGPLSKEYISRIYQALAERSVDSEKFVHIQYAENFSDALHNANIDLFLTPFPIPSARICIEVMSCGIPILYYKPIDEQPFEAVDFCDPEQFSWSNKQELLSTIKNLNAMNLNCKSMSSYKYFEENHDFNRNYFKIINLHSNPINIDTEQKVRIKDILYEELYDISEVKALIEKSNGLENAKGEEIAVAESEVLNVTTPLNQSAIARMRKWVAKFLKV